MSNREDSRWRWYEYCFPLIFGLLLYWSVNSWLQNGVLLLGEHSGRTFREAWHYWQFFRNGGSMPLSGYPPLSSWLYCLGAWVNGQQFSAQAAATAQACLLIPLGYAVYALGRRLGGPWGGVLVLLANSGNLWLNWYSRGLFLEIGETLFVTSALVTYLASENFRRLGYALLFGICVGLGLLTKWALIFYMLPLGAYALFMLVSAPSETCKEGEVIAQSPEIETATVRIGQEILSLNLHREVVAKQTQLSSSEVNEKAENSEKLVSPWLGVSVALLAALSLSGWWYWAAWSELVWKSSRDLAQNYSGLVCLRQLFYALNNCWWLYFTWCLLGIFWAFKQPDIAKRNTAFLIVAMSLSAASIYAILGVPGAARYMLPATVMGLCLAFAWIGQYHFWRFGVAIALTLVSFVQLGLIYFPGTIPVNEALNRCSWRISTLRNNNAAVERAERTEEAAFLDSILKVILPQLDKSKEERFTAVVFAQGRGLDADLLLLRALEKYGRLLDIDIYVPINYEFLPQSSLLLQIGGSAEEVLKNKHFQGYTQIKEWHNKRAKTLRLYRHSEKRDLRPCR